MLLYLPVQFQLEAMRMYTVEHTEQGIEVGWRRGEVPGNWATMAFCGQAGTPLNKFQCLLIWPYTCLLLLGSDMLDGLLFPLIS